MLKTIRLYYLDSVFLFPIERMSNLVLIGKLNNEAWCYANSGLEKAFVYELLRLNNKTKCSPDIYFFTSCVN